MKDMDDPTNRDSVPAMLTPGEFVLNKEASQMFGPMIEKMNAHGLAQRHAGNQGYNTGGKVDPFDDYFERLLKAEGGWSDHAADRGGKTNLGITLKTLKSINPKATEKDLRNLTKEQAKEIYRKNYYDGPGISKLPENIREQAFDISVNAGPGRAAKFVQELGGVAQDGIIGPDTIAAAANVDNNALANRRQAHYDSIVANDPSQQAFQRGWKNRADKFRMDTPAPPPMQEAPPSPQAHPQAVNDPEVNPSFGDAFSAARAEQGEGGQFSWRGNDYTTDLARNVGGSIPIPQGLNVGGWLKSLFSGPDQNAGYADMTQQDFLNEAETFNNPGAQATGYSVPGMPAPLMPDGGGVAPTGASSPQSTLPTAIHAGNRFNFEAPAVDLPPEITTAPPVPGSDEALLQGSSDTVESIEASLPVGSPERMAAIEAGTLEPTDADFDFEEQQYALTQDLNQNRLNQAVQADDSLGAEFNAQREADLLTQLDVLQNPDTLGGPPPIPGTDFNPAVAPDGGFTQGEANQLAIPEMPEGVPNVITDAPTHKASANTVKEVANRRVDAEERIRAADAEYTSAVEGLQTAKTDSEIERFQRKAAQAKEAKDVAVADQQTALDHQGNVDRQAALAQAEAGDRATSALAATEDARSAALESVGAAPVANPNSPQGRAALTTRVDELDQAVVDGGESPEVTQEEAARVEEAGATASPAKVEKAKNIISENFGGLFDKKELARAAVLFAGAMVTGMSPQRALAFAGRGYIQRLDTKEAMQAKSRAAIDKRIREGKPVIDRTNPEEFIVNGKKVNTFTMTQELPDGTTVKTRTLPDGTPMPASAHQNFDTVPGTPEYRKRVGAEASDYSGIVKEFKANQGHLGTFDGKKSYATDINPEVAGRDAAKWAIKNGVPTEAMGTMLNNAMTSAAEAGKYGQKAKSIEAYLNEQFIEAEVGDPSLFGDVPADKVVSLVKRTAQAAGIEGSGISQSTPVLQTAMSEWDKVTDKERYIRQAKGTGLTPFMVWMEEDLNS